jgi:hypothetical protein
MRRELEEPAHHAACAADSKRLVGWGWARRGGLRVRATIFNSPGTMSADSGATFYTTGMEHSPTSATGTGWERTPWHAVRRAAWEALRTTEDDIQ